MAFLLVLGFKINKDLRLRPLATYGCVSGADPKVYTEVKDLEKLQKTMTDYLSDYNAASKQPMQLVLFNFALEHVSRICRIITSPGGHALLVGLGGSGRQSLTKLAGFIEEFEVFQIEVSKTYGKVLDQHVPNYIDVCSAGSLPCSYLRFIAWSCWWNMTKTRSIAVGRMA